MGGRGASSGMSEKGRTYGTEYTTLYTSGNIKFVRYNDSKSAKTPMETMTKGRIYATINAQGELKNITYYDKHNKRYKQIDRGHLHFVDKVALDPHTHKGYWHRENGTHDLNSKERKMLERAQKAWYYYNNRQ